VSKTYIGVSTFRRQGGSVASVLVEQAGTRTPLRHVSVHSPTGLEWGYGGSGPADTALAILLDATGEADRLPRSAFRFPLSRRARATYTFHLRRNVRFHNGASFTAEDVLFKFQRALDPRSGHTHPEYYRDIVRMEAPDPYTVAFRLRQPNSEFLFNLARPDSVLGPRGRVEEQRTQPVGTGPFRFVAWERGVGIRLERFSAYYEGGRPYLDRVTFRILPDQNAQLAALRSGDVDVLGYGVVPENALALQRDPGMRVIVGTTTTEITVGMNNSRPPFNDTHVRRALQYAIDKDELIRGVMTGGGIDGAEQMPDPGRHKTVGLARPSRPDAARHE
jgi:peptide/nickel transport system substrate-binding protein